MDALQQMYQQVILEHAKKPHGRVPGVPTAAGLLSVPTAPGSPGSPTAAGEPRVAMATVGTQHEYCGPGVGVSHQVNPTCGDEITLQVEVNDGKVKSVTWQGQGCSISQASASVMTDLVTDNSVSQAQVLDKLFHDLMNSRGKGLDDTAEEQLEDAVAFTGTSQYPARIKCALLGWAALKDALANADAST